MSSNSDRESDDLQSADIPEEVAEQLPDEAEYEFVDFYASHNFVEIDMLVDILRDQGVHCFSRKMEPPGLPVSVGREGEQWILVEDDKLEEARRIIEEAVAEGPIPDDGKFLPQD